MINLQMKEMSQLMNLFPPKFLIDWAWFYVCANTI